MLRFHKVTGMLGILVLSGLLAGCPESDTKFQCGECPLLTECSEEERRCKPPSHVGSGAVSSAASAKVDPLGRLIVAAHIERTRDIALGVYDEPSGQVLYRTLDSDGDVGRDASLALFGDGRPAVAYFDATAERLKFAFFTEEGELQIEIVDDTSSVGEDISLFVDAEGVPHVAYRNISTTRPGLRYARRVLGVWRIELVDTGIDPTSQIPENEACPTEQRALVGLGVGFGARIAIQGTTPVITYYDADCGALRVARRAADGMWTLRVIDGWDPDSFGAATSVPRTEVGRHSDTAIDPLSGNVVFAYHDVTLGVLKVARTSEGLITITIVDDGVRTPESGAPEKRIVGLMPSIAFTPTGGIEIVHMDASNRSMLRSVNVDGTWSTESFTKEEVFYPDFGITTDGRRYWVGETRQSGVAQIAVSLP